MTTDPFTTAESGPGWYEFIMPGGSTTHIAYAYEDGSVYLPEGPDVVEEVDFRLAAASARFWKLTRVAQEPTDAEVLAALNADYALRFGPRNLPADSLEPYGEEAVRIMRAALSAARAARRDETGDQA